MAYNKLWRKHAVKNIDQPIIIISMVMTLKTAVEMAWWWGLN